MIVGCFDEFFPEEVFAERTDAMDSVGERRIGEYVDGVVSVLPADAGCRGNGGVGGTTITGLLVDESVDEACLEVLLLCEDNLRGGICIDFGTEATGLDSADPIEKPPFEDAPEV